MKIFKFVLSVAFFTYVCLHLPVLITTPAYAEPIVIAAGLVWLFYVVKTIAYMYGWLLNMDRTKLPAMLTQFPFLVYIAALVLYGMAHVDRGASQTPYLWLMGIAYIGFLVRSVYLVFVRKPVAKKK